MSSEFRVLEFFWRGLWGSFLGSGVHGLGLGLGRQDAFARVISLFGVCVLSLCSLLSPYQEPELASSKLTTAWALTEGDRL